MSLRVKLDAQEIRQRLRIKELMQIFAHRYGGEGWAFPDDDAGREDLFILISHIMRADPLAPARIANFRAPWMVEDEAQRLIDRAFMEDQMWTPAQLGREMNLSNEEWRAFRTRTISPPRLSPEERRRITQTDYDSVVVESRAQGRDPRAKADLSLGRNWVLAALSISRCSNSLADK